VNVLALEVHRSALGESWARIVDKEMAVEGGNVRVVDLKLTAGADDAATPNVGRPAGLQVVEQRPHERGFRRRLRGPE